MNKDVSETPSDSGSLTVAAIDSQMDFGDSAQEVRFQLPKDVISYFENVAQREGVEVNALMANVLINSRLSEVMACARALRRAGHTVPK